MKQDPILQASLSADSNVPLYYQLVGIIKRNIAAGLLTPGDLLPSEAELCKALAISRSTVRQAIGTLESEGLVVRRQGKGTFIAEPKVRRRTESVYSFTSEINAMGKTPSSAIIEFAIITPPEDIVRMLELRSADTRCYKFTRVRKVDGEPLILETSYYPQYIYPNLTRELLETHSFYSLLYEVGVVPETALDSYQAVCCTTEEAALLGCEAGSPCFFVQRRTRSSAGELYEFTQSLLRGDRTHLDLVLGRDGISFTRAIDRGTN
jgi:GntR family transcriptional regulator